MRSGLAASGIIHKAIYYYVPTKDQELFGRFTSVVKTVCKAQTQFLPSLCNNADYASKTELKVSFIDLFLEHNSDPVPWSLSLCAHTGGHPTGGVILHRGWLHLRVVVQKRWPPECGHLYGRKWFHTVF